MKKFLSVLLILCMAASMLSLSACGKDAGNQPNSDTMSPGSSYGQGAPEMPVSEQPAEPEATPTPTPEVPGVDNSNFELVSVLTGFRDGWAQIEFRNTSADIAYRGIIDTNGKLHAYTELRSDPFDVYDLGHMYLSLPDAMYVIDPAGGVYSVPNSDGHDVISVYYGYALRLEEESKTVHIYGPDGNELTSVTDESLLPLFDYVGEETFVLPLNHGAGRDDKGNSLTYADLYFAQSDTWLKEQLIHHSSSSIGMSFGEFQDGIFFLYNGTDESGVRQLCFVDSKGTLQTAPIPDEVDRRMEYQGCTDGKLYFLNVLTSNYNTVSCYNTKTGQWKQYRQKNTTIIGDILLEDGVCALSIGVTDKYSVLLNDDMERVCNPLPGSPVKIENGFLYTKSKDTLYCYDLQGNLIPDQVYDGYNDGISVHGYGINAKFLRPDGTPAFESIDCSTGKLVTLP